MTAPLDLKALTLEIPAAGAGGRGVGGTGRASGAADGGRDNAPPFETVLKHQTEAGPGEKGRESARGADVKPRGSEAGRTDDEASVAPPDVNEEEASLQDDDTRFASGSIVGDASHPASEKLARAAAIVTERASSEIAAERLAALAQDPRTAHGKPENTGVSDATVELSTTRSPESDRTVSQLAGTSGQPRIQNQPSLAPAPVTDARREADIVAERSVWNRMTAQQQAQSPANDEPVGMKVVPVPGATVTDESEGAAIRSLPDTAGRINQNSSAAPGRLVATDNGRLPAGESPAESTARVTTPPQSMEALELTRHRPAQQAPEKPGAAFEYQTGIDRLMAAKSGNELPESGKSLPSALLQTPAPGAPGLVTRTELMTRTVGQGRERATFDDSAVAPGIEKPTLNLRSPLAELLTGLTVQAQQVAAGREVSASATGNFMDSNPASLLAQYLGQADRSGVVRTALPAGLETIQLAPLQGQPGSMDWSSQLGNRIRWMSNLNLSSAELKLYPAELGTLEILISAEDDQARVNFITSSATTRELIENSLPRLRELLGQSGLLLEQGDVSQRDLNRQSNRESAAITGEAPPSVPESDAANPGQVPLYQPGGAYQVDQYA